MSLPLTALPRDPVTLARFGLAGLPPSTWLMRRFRDERAQALFAGLVAHVMAPLDGIATGAVGLVFALAAHARGWPVARGGSQSISDALTAYLKDLGGTVHTDYEVKRLDDLPPARAYVFDTSPAALSRIAGFGRYYEDYRYGASVFKIDYALDGPVPGRPRRHASPGRCRWARAAPRSPPPCAPPRARAGRRTPLPDHGAAQRRRSSRAPEGKQVFWAYGHVPNGWTGDLTDAIERQLERFAPGFRDRVLARATAGPPELAARNANYVGGDIGCGAAAGLQLLLRPKLSCSRTAHRTRPSSSVPRPPRRAPVCTACRGTTRRRPCGGACVTPDRRMPPVLTRGDHQS